MSLIAKNYKFELMELPRYNQILHSTRGSSLNDRIGLLEDDDWIPNREVLSSLRNLKQKIFEPSRNLLYNKKNGHIVIDDELVSLRAKDVSKKTVQHRKKGKEGLSIDCVSCSLTSVLLGMRLRVPGCAEIDNVVY